MCGEAKEPLCPHLQLMLLLHINLKLATVNLHNNTVKKQKPGGHAAGRTYSKLTHSPISARPSAMPRITMPAMTITMEMA